MPSPEMVHEKKTTLLAKVATVTFNRLLLNTSRRFPYTFAMVLSRGMNVPLTAITGLIAFNQITGVLGVFFGPIADRTGYRLVMMAGMGMLVVSMFAAGLFPIYGVVLASLFLAGLSKNIFDPALQAYVGERVPYHRRGLVIGILETAWAGSTLVGIPVIAVLIDRWGWRSPFFVLGAFGAMGLILMSVLLKEQRDRRLNRLGSAGIWRAWKGMLHAWSALLRQRTVQGTILSSFCIGLAADNLFVVYGPWLEKSFELGVVAIGVGTSVIGIAELGGEFLTAAFADRLGLKRAIAAGLVMGAVFFALLPLIATSLPMALFGLFCIFISIEFTIVSYISLCTELVPGARATMMSLFFASAALGRIIGAFAGGPTWLSGGMTANGMVSALFTALGLGALVWGLCGWERNAP